jgi:hypothetical protein
MIILRALQFLRIDTDRLVGVTFLMKVRLFVALGAIMILAAGCQGLFDQTSSTTAPTNVTTQMMGGSWASVSSTTALSDTCTDFHWGITTISGTSGSGTFSAKCFGSMPVAGTANGMLSGSAVTWTATGAGVTPAGAACPFSLNGTATFDGTQFRIPFSGTTCMGPVSGAEILRKS